MAGATEDRISRALQLLSALEREDRRRAAARRRRRMSVLYATSLAALGIVAAAPGVFAAAPKGLAQSLIGGVGAIARDLRESMGLADSEGEADSKPPPGPSGAGPAGLKIILSAPPAPSAPCSRESCFPGGERQKNNVKAKALAF
jgi:hypothetical protein